MSGTTPVLSYIGSVDTSSVSTGTVMFSVDFDPAIAVLMFEYKYQPASVVNPTPEDLTYSGFIYPESAQPVQGSNHVYYLPIPAINSADEYNIAVRVYDANDLGVTNWSNDLEVHVPPPRPLIANNGTAYDRGAYPGTTTLWVNLDPSYNVAGNEYIVSYYYVPEGTSTTHWVVTDLLEPSGNVLEVNMDGIVSNVAGLDYVYVAVNAVSTFVYAGTTYYSVSEISNTEDASQATVNPPSLDSIEYLVYVNRTQNMILNWTAPYASFIPSFGVASYDIYVSVNLGYPSLLATVTGTVTTYNVNVSSYGVHDSLTFYLTATLTSGTVTPASDEETENIFYYAQAPATLYYNWAVYEEDSSQNIVDVSFTFTDSPNTGSGAIEQYVWQITQLVGYVPTIVATGDVDYAGPGHQYNVIASFIYNSDPAYTYTIEVFLQTTNTNPPGETLNGAAAISSSIVPSNVPFIYDVVNGLNTLSFKVSSNVILNPSAAIFYVNAISGEISALAYSTTSVIPVEIDGNYVYSFSATASFNFATGKYTITASNQAGIGYKIVNHVA
jgi:hypothetical protein